MLMRRHLLAGSRCLLLLGIACCVPPADTPNDDPNDADDPGGSFAQAKGVVYDSSDFVAIPGVVAEQTDVDVYSLGALFAGDRLVVNVDGAVSLDASVACFDADGRLFRENDDEDLAANKLDPFIDEIVRRDSDPYFLAITSSPFGPSTGDYTINVQVIRGAETARVVGSAQTPLLETETGLLADLSIEAGDPARAAAKLAAIRASADVAHAPFPCGTCRSAAARRNKLSAQLKLGGSQQVFLLDFDGATVNIPGDQTYNIAALDAAEIDESHAGETDALKQIIIDVFIERFGDLDVALFTTDDEQAPPEPFTRIVFGGLNPTIFGIAQDIDPYNAVPSDEAIVFANTFNVNVFGRVLTIEELGLAIGQVAAHEAGHTLGLYHVSDVTDLMDTVGGPSTLVDVQVFKNSVLDKTVFPIGTQDSALLLEETLGFAP
jgi:hypothetical protein